MLAESTTSQLLTRSHSTATPEAAALAITKSQ
jgi:hypothetical protein